VTEVRHTDRDPVVVVPGPRIQLQVSGSSGTEHWYAHVYDDDYYLAGNGSTPLVAMNDLANAILNAWLTEREQTGGG
jgi:hypothetical protein